MPTSTEPNTVRKHWSNRTILAVLIIGLVVTGVLLSVFATPTVYASTKKFTPYSTPVSESSNGQSGTTSMEVTDMNGGITMVPWNQPNVLFNGTVTARGFSASPDAVSFVESNSSGAIEFKAVFPSTVGFFLFPSYSVDINVYFPSSSNIFGSIQVTDTNGNIEASTLSATSIKIGTTNGNVHASIGSTRSVTLTTISGRVDLTCFECVNATATTTNGGITARLSTVVPTGSYAMTSTNGNVDVSLPSSSSCKLGANTTNGAISTSGLGLSAQAGTTLNATLLTGSATVNLKTVNGSITITGV